MDDLLDDLTSPEGSASLGLAPAVQAAATGALLTDVRTFIRRFVVMTDAQILASSLWVMMTWILEVTDTLLYLWIRSAEPESGKTRLLEVLELLVAAPWLTARTTAAALVRKVAGGVTLLLDESDAAFKSGEEYGAALAGVLNAGYRRSGVASLCVGQGANIAVVDFPVFGPKAIAGIGMTTLPDTVRARSIPILLRRRKRTERIEPFFRADVAREAADLRDRLRTWGEAMTSFVRGVRPAIPQELTDRQAEGWIPLLSIAVFAGVAPQAAAAAAELHADRREQSARVQTLAAIKDTFEGRDRLSTADLLRALVERDDGPWAEWWGKAVSAGELRGPAAKLARLLREYEIEPRQIRFSETNLRGYERVQFLDAWERLLSPLFPQESLQTLQTLRENAIVASVASIASSGEQARGETE